MCLRMAALLLPLLLVSCSDTGVTPTPQELSASTEQSHYAPGETIRISFHNSGIRSLDLASCCFTFACYIDIEDNGTWKDYESRGLPCLLLCPGIRLLVNPGQTFVDSLIINDPGTFRLRVPYTSPDNSETAEVMTNSFSVQSIR
jgi:hypothetical protein